MRYFFISYNYPGKLGDMAAWLAEDTENKVIFASSRQMHDVAIPGVQRVILKKPDLKKKEGPKKYLEFWIDAIKTGLYASSTLESILDSGFIPDIIMASSANGSIFGLPQIFTQSFIVNFMEDIGGNNSTGQQMQTILQYIQSAQADMTFSFTKKQMERLPDYLRKKTALAPVAVNTSFFSPQSGRSFYCWKFSDSARELITINLKNIPASRLQTCWQWILELLSACAGYNFVILVNNSFFKKYLSEQCMRLDIPRRERIFIEGFMRREVYRDLLTASKICIFPDTSSEISIPMLECMSCARPIICNIIDNDFLKENYDYIPIKNVTIGRINNLLSNAKKLAEIGINARMSVESHYNMMKIYPGFFSNIIAQYKSSLLN